MVAKRSAPIGMAVMLLVCGARTAIAGPITFPTALPVASSQVILRAQYLFVRAGDDPTPADRRLAVQGMPLVAAVGVTPRLAVFGVLPLLHTSMRVSTPSGRVTRAATGLGDVVAFARYTVYARDTLDSTFRIAPFGGLTLPTGQTGAADALGPLPRPLQLGSGSWDGLGGLAVTWQTKGWELDAAVEVTRNTEADGFRVGDEVAADASVQYRLWPRRLGAGVPAFLYAVVETNVASQARSELAGVPDPDSGGARWNMGVGLQHVTASYIVEGIVQLPVLAEPNGTGLRNVVQVRAGLRWNVSLPF